MASLNYSAFLIRNTEYLSSGNYLIFFVQFNMAYIYLNYFLDYGNLIELKLI